MAIAKVIFNDGQTTETWMDVTQDTVEAGNLLAGETATRNDGVSITGTVVTASPYDSNPAMDGTASAGTASTYSRGDHVHPSDTSRVPTSRTINGKALTSNISLTASDVGALSSSTSIPSKTSDLTNDSGFITSAGAPVQSVNGQTGAVTISVPTKTSDLTNDSGYITDAGVTSFNGSTGAVTYTAPVTSVNSQTGAVTLSIPSATSDLTNDSGFITSAGAPVQSVNGSTGAVTLSIPSATSDLTNDSGFITSSALSSYVPKSTSAGQGASTGTITNSSSSIALNSSMSTYGSASLQMTGSNGNVVITSNNYNSSPQQTNTLTITPSSTTIHNVVTPTANGDAANKKYVDDSISGITFPVTSVNGSTGAVTIAVPTATSDLTNDSGFITLSDIPDQIYYVEINGTVNWAEVAAAYNAGKLIVGKDQYGLLFTLYQIAIYNTTTPSSLDKMTFFAAYEGGNSLQVGYVLAIWNGSSGWSFSTTYNLATTDYVEERLTYYPTNADMEDAIADAIGTAIAASY